MLRSFLLVGAGGAAGSMARYGIGYVVGKFVTNPFPIATFSINLAGSLLIGVLFGLASRYQLLQGGSLWLLLASGFCSGFTTFSSFALENITLMQKGQPMTAVAYAVSSVVLGLLLCRLGMWLAGYTAAG